MAFRVGRSCRLAWQWSSASLRCCSASAVACSGRHRTCSRTPRGRGCSAHGASLRADTLEGLRISRWAGALGRRTVGLCSSALAVKPDTMQSSCGVCSRRALYPDAGSSPDGCTRLHETALLSFCRDVLASVACVSEGRIVVRPLKSSASGAEIRAQPLLPHVAPLVRAYRSEFGCSMLSCDGGQTGRQEGSSTGARN